MRQILGVLLIVLGIDIVVPDVARAQVSTAQISGRVTDASGAVLPGVTVTATQTETQFVRTTVTNEVGAFTLPNLPVGPYRLEAALQGFQTFAQIGHHAAGERQPRVDPALPIGDIAETVTVEARPSDIEVETRRMGVGTVVEQERILELPLNARQVTDLITVVGRRRPGAELGHRDDGHGRQHLRRRRRALRRAIPARRRGEQQPVRRHQHAAAVPRRAAGVPHQHERAGGGSRPLVRRVGQRGHQGRDEPVPRQRLLVRARHTVQRPRGARGHQGQAAAEPARRIDRRTDPREQAVLLHRLPEHDSRPDALRHAVDRADGRDPCRRLARLQCRRTARAGPIADFADGFVDPVALQPGGPAPRRAPAAADQRARASCCGATTSIATTSRR